MDIRIDVNIVFVSHLFERVRYKYDSKKQFKYLKISITINVNQLILIYDKPTYKTHFCRDNFIKQIIFLIFEKPFQLNHK